MPTTKVQNKLYTKSFLKIGYGRGYKNEITKLQID